MIKVLTIGFSRKELLNNENIMWLIHTPGQPKDLTSKEYYLQCSEIVNKVDIVLLNLTNKGLEFDESILLHLSYTNFTPVFSVGHGDFPMSSEMILRRFESLEHAIDHIVANYVMKRRYFYEVFE